jgi:hypothetical protein
MKKIALFGIIALIMPSVLADYGHMMGYGYGMGTNIGIGIFGFVWFLIATFIFSVVFWSTYKWIIKSKTRWR